MARRIRPVAEPEPNEQLDQRLAGMSHEDLVDLVVVLVAQDAANERVVDLHMATGCR